MYMYMYSKNMKQELKVYCCIPDSILNMTSTCISNFGQIHVDAQYVSVIVTSVLNAFN